jgi:phage FluMu protein Com
MNTPITLDIRCGNCNKKLSEVTPPVTLMIQRIKCPRCGEIVETYVIKPTNGNHKPQKKPTHKPQEIPRYHPEETKVLPVEPSEIKATLELKQNG